MSIAAASSSRAVADEDAARSGVGRRRCPPRRPRRRPRTPVTGPNPSSSRSPARRSPPPAGARCRARAAPARSSTSRAAKPGAATTSATVGRPRVSVPVLSKTTVSTRWATSSASPPRMRMPASAPRPVPTMIAVGVARPIAHGQAMTTTPMKAVSASVSRGSGPNTSQTDERAGGDEEHDRDEDLGDPVGQALDRGLAALGALTRSTIRASAVSRPTRVARITNVPVVFSVAPMTSSPAADLDRHRLAGQHRSVDRRRALDDDAVDRDLLAGADPQQVADDDRLERRRPPRDRPATPARGRRLQPDEPADRPGRAGLGAGLQPATEQDEPDDDRRGVEVGLGMQPGLVDDARAGASRPRCTAQAALVPTATSVSMFVVPCRAARQAAR